MHRSDPIQLGNHRTNEIQNCLRSHVHQGLKHFLTKKRQTENHTHVGDKETVRILRCHPVWFRFSCHKDISYFKRAQAAIL